MCRGGRFCVGNILRNGRKKISDVTGGQRDLLESRAGRGEPARRGLCDRPPLPVSQLKLSSPL